MLQIRLFGDCAVSAQDQPIGGISTDRSQALLAYLILHHHAPQPRHRIATQLWPDSTDTQARANLRKELSFLRRSLPNPESVLWVDGKTLQWQLGDSCWVDVVAFETALKTAEQASTSAQRRSLLGQAVELYRDDLLPCCGDEWILPERERLQQRYQRALSSLIDYLEQGQDYAAAIAYGQQLLRLDALSEVAYCTLMRLYALSGDRANALQIYHRCMNVLREELGIDPSPATRRLYDQLLHDEDSLGVSRSEQVESSSVQPPPTPNTPTSLFPSASPLSSIPASAYCSRPGSDLLPLVGRQAEWNQVQQWLGMPPAERQLMLVVGEPGIGKTRLLQQVQTTLRDTCNSHVLWGRGFEAEIVRPYGVWIDAVRSLAAKTVVPIPSDLSVLWPDSGTAQGFPGDRSRLFDAMVQYLAGLCADDHAVLVVFDDLQWIDEASSALLHYVSRVLSGLPIWFACTARSKELGDNEAVLRVMQALRREGRLWTLELSALNSQQTAELVHLVGAGAPSPISVSLADVSAALHDRIFVESGGNPLFALELARALAYGDRSPADNLERLICDRLQRLDESARDLIPWAAALGQRFKPTLVAHVADYPLAKLLLAIEHLERESIIRASEVSHDESSYDFAHDIVRQVAYRQLSEPRRRLVHLQIARQLHLLADTHPDWMPDIAHHAALGGDRILAASASLAAAERSLKVFAYAEAAELAQRGIQHCRVLDDRTRIQLQVQLMRVAVTAGVAKDRVPDLEAEIQMLIDQAHTLGLTDAEAIGYEVVLILHFDANDFAKMQQRSQQMVEASRAASPATMARMLAYSGSCLAEIERDMARAEALLLEAQSLAARVGTEWTDIPCGLGCVQRFHGHYDEARQLLQHAVHRAKAEQDHWREYNALSYLMMTELDDGHPAAALPYGQEIAIVATQMKGEGSEGAIAQALTALARYQLDAATASVELEQAIAALHIVDTKRMLAYVLLGAAAADVNAGQHSLARQRAEQALQSAQAVNQPSETALSYALLLQSAIATGEAGAAPAQNWLKMLQQCDRALLNWRSRTIIERVLQRSCLVLAL